MSYVPRRTSTPIALCVIFRVAVIFDLHCLSAVNDAIARRAGLSTTAVRRHIAVIMGRLNVSSRFAAGAAAQRRGWIGQATL
jgi:ATP/maltotriose-dependent transcriptional regulator MalT